MRLYLSDIRKGLFGARNRQMENADLKKPAFVFWMRRSRLGPGRITRFEHLEQAVDCVMQHSLARSAQVAWIKTVTHHLDMDQIRAMARHDGLVSYLSKTELAR